MTRGPLRIVLPGRDHLFALSRRGQPLSPRAYRLAALRGWGERPAADRPQDGSGLIHRGKGRFNSNTRLKA